jgi:hypothetical protein
MIEDRLADTLERVAAAAPPEAGAFDRFLGHRARRARRAAGATALTLVVVVAVAAAVAVPRFGHHPDRRPRLYVSGVAAPQPWQRGPLVAVAPDEGFEVDVPAGWEATPTWKGIALRPVSPELRRLLGVPVALDTTYLEAFFQPSTRDLYRDSSQLPRPAAPRPRDDPQTRGRFPDGRAWFRTDGQAGGWWFTRWYVSWPYHCQPGRRCPDVLAMRALRVAFQVHPAAFPQVAGLAEGLLRSARPITNAVPGRPHAPRPDCLEGRSMTVQRSVGSSWPPSARPVVAKLSWTFSTTANMVPCTIRGPVGAELVDGSGGRLAVAGNPLALAPVGDLPDSQRWPAEAGTLEVSLKWINWCDRGPGPVRLRWIGPPGPGRTVPIRPPRCIDRSKPSRLSVERIRR